jgi:hypothetical protein
MMIDPMIFPRSRRVGAWPALRCTAPPGRAGCGQGQIVLSACLPRRQRGHMPTRPRESQSGQLKLTELRAPPPLPPPLPLPLLPPPPPPLPLLRNSGGVRARL